MRIRFFDNTDCERRWVPRTDSRERWRSATDARLRDRSWHFFQVAQKQGGRRKLRKPDPYLSDCLVRDEFSTFGNLNKVPDNSLEFVLALNVLEHIADDGAALRHLGTKLMETRRLLVYAPAFKLLWTSIDEKIKHHRRYRRKDHVAGCIVKRESQRGVRPYPTRNSAAG